nr:helix-turn-helix domain-containing protein [Cohnella zeiphila]
MYSDHFRESDAYWIERPEGRSDWLIAFTLAGEGYFQVPGRETALCGPGEIALLKPGTPHRYGTSSGKIWDFFWVHFSPERIEASLLPDESLAVRKIDNEHARKRIYRAFRRILEDWRQQGDYWEDLCYGALREILMLLERRRRRKLDVRVEETLRLLSRQMQHPTRIDELARSVGLSPSRLSHLFKEGTGQSIIDSLNEMRIRQAALLLEHSGRSASEVCYEVGFQNYNHFINQFRKRLGMSPTAYKKQKRDHWK